MLVLITNRKSHTDFQFVPIPVTSNDLERVMTDDFPPAPSLRQLNFLYCPVLKIDTALLTYE